MCVNVIQKPFKHRDFVNKNNQIIDLLVIGGGASGLMAAIGAARQGASVLVCEKMKKPGMKILASGGERCNVTNTLDHKTYIEHFGKQGRFMQSAMDTLGNERIQTLFQSFGIETMSRDGFRVFPSSHKSQTVLDGLLNELKRLDVPILTETPVLDLKKSGRHWLIKTKSISHIAKCVVLSTGGLTYPWLGSDGQGYSFAEALGHKCVERHPGGVPLKTKETWTANCRADTIGKAHIKVNMKKHNKIGKTGDVIFTNYGIAGPVVLDLAREITPLVDKYGEVPITLSLRPKMTQQDWQDLIATWKTKNHSQKSLVSLLKNKLPESICIELCRMVNIDPDHPLLAVSPARINDLIAVLNATPLTVNGSMGYKLAFITRGGIKLKEICNKTLESKILPGLYLCGEVVDLDGPCGGYNLTWAFSSGYLAGISAAISLSKIANNDPACSARVAD